MRNFLPVISPWASGAGATYPAGFYDWSGQPTKVVVPFAYFTPTKLFAPTAGEWNAILNQRDTWLTDIEAWTGMLDGLNWGPVQDGNAIAYTFFGIQWNDLLGAWLASEENGTGPHCFTFQSYDGVNWSEFANEMAPATYGAPVAWVTFGGALYAFRSGGSVAPATQAWNQATNQWAGVVAGPTGFVITQTQNAIFNFTTSASVAGVVWTQTRTSGAGAAKIAFASAIGFWTVSSSSLPANFGANPATQTLFRAVSPGLALLFSPSSADVFYLSSYDGINWTTNAMPAFLTGEVVCGADYDAVNGIFYLALTSATAGPGATPQTRLFYSAGGFAWTLGKTFAWGAEVPPASNGRGCIACNGGEIAILLQVNGDWRIALSTSGNLPQWGFARVGSGSGTGSLSSTGFLDAAGGGFLYQDGRYFAMTIQAGTPVTSLL